MIRQLLLPSILCTLLVRCDDLAASQTFQANGSKGNSALSVDNVVERLADFLWNTEFGMSLPFVVKGSYAAAAWAEQRASGLKLPFNDIDVMVETPVPSDRCPNTFGFVKSRYVEGLIPDTTVQVTVVCELDAQDLIKKSDINAVGVGFKVVPEKTAKTDNVVPKVEEWIWTPHFEEFIKTKTLEVVYDSHGHMAQDSTFRLLRKAQQTSFNFKFPDNIEKYHGGAVSPSSMGRFDSLDDNHKKHITDHFDLVPNPRKKDWHMFVLKGREVPEFPRKLQNSGYTPAPTPADQPTNPAEGPTSNAMFAKLFTAASLAAAGLLVILVA